MDARSLNGAYTLKVVAEHSYGAWANGTHQITCFFTSTNSTSPTISSISPTSGKAGDAVTINGSNFGTTQGTSSVKFGSTAATVTSWSDTQVKVTVPSGTGTVSVNVTTSGGTSNGVSFTYAATVPVPSISSISPTSGAAGVAVTINGSNFGATQGSSSVKFGSTAASVTSWSNTQIKVTAPSGTGTASVTVTTSGGTSNGISFTYATTGTAPSITSISPTSGKPGDVITINGSKFGATQGTSSVKFGSTVASISTWSDTKIQAKAPTGSGTVSVIVTTSAGTSNGVSFTYVALPNLTPYKPSGWSDKIVVAKTTGTTTDGTGFLSTDTLYIDWAVINNGNATVETRFCTKLYVDNVAKATWYKDPPVKVWYDTKVFDYNIGKLAAGTHKIMILTDCSNVVPEVNESDNTYTKTITVK